MPTIDEIQNDVACPACQYNLRGLRGAVVNCPECGRECDIAEIIRRRWTKPWHQAPGMTTVYIPCAVAVLAPLLGAFLFVPAGFREDMRLGMILTVFGSLLVWSFFLYRAWLLFESMEGVGLALMSHIIFAFYIVGVFGAIWTIGTFFSSNWLTLLGSVPLIALAFLGQRGERFIAGRCIRRYLNRPPGS